MKTYTICDSCPCLSDNDGCGGYCNLGHDVSYEHFGQILCGENSHWVSKNCELVHIKTKDNYYYPAKERMEIVELKPTGKQNLMNEAMKSVYKDSLVKLFK